MTRRGELALDRWSWVHVASGVVLGFTGMTWYWAVGLLVAYEGLEGALRHIKVQEGGLFEYESWPNIAGDLVVGTGGYLASYLLSPWHWPWS